MYKCTENPMANVQGTRGKCTENPCCCTSRGGQMYRNLNQMYNENLLKSSKLENKDSPSFSHIFLQKYKNTHTIVHEHTLKNK